METGVIAHARTQNRRPNGTPPCLTALFRYLPGDPASYPVPPEATVIAKRHGVLTVTWP